MNTHSTWLWRTVGATALAALTAAGLIGCSSNSSSSSSRPANEIQILVYGDSSNSVEKYAVDTYNATAEGKKVKAVLQTIPGANYQAKLQTIINTKQAPDVFFNWGGGSIQPFVKAGLLLPLDSMMASNPDLKNDFLPSILNAAKVDGKYYGIPMRGTQPVVLFYNKTVLAQNNLQAPTTWTDLLADVSTLKAKGITPIALGGGDQWPTLMWYEYVYDRVCGPDLVTKAQAGDTSEWSSSCSTKALGYLTQLVQAGAFGTSFDSVKATDGSSAKLMRTGKAAFELMGSWDYSTQQSADANFAAKDLGYIAFPTISGGAGNPSDLAGNTNNYYSVLKNTRYPDAVADFLKIMYSPDFVQKLMAIGDLPTTTNTEQFIPSQSDATWLQWQYNLVKNAAAFQLSWDQAWPQTATNAMHTAVEQFFDNPTDPQAFISSMQSLPLK